MRSKPAANMVVPGVRTSPNDFAGFGSRGAGIPRAMQPGRLHHNGVDSRNPLRDATTGGRHLGGVGPDDPRIDTVGLDGRRFGEGTCAVNSADNTPR